MLQVPQPDTTRYGKNLVKYLTAITWNKISDTLRSLHTLSASKIACSRLSDCGEDAKVKGMRKVGGAGKKGKRKPPLLSPVSSPFIFVFAFSQFSEPDYLRRSLEQATSKKRSPPAKVLARENDSLLVLADSQK